MTTPNYHPDSLYLTDFAAGSLDHGLAITVKAHLELCSECRNSVKQIEQIGMCLFEEPEATSLSLDLFDKLLSRIEQPEAATKPAAKYWNNELPMIVNQLTAKPLADLSWRKLTRTLQFFKLSTGDNKHEIALYNIAAGGYIPKHKHRCDEVTVVLSGSFSDEDGLYKKGDFIVRKPGETHSPIATQHENCLCLTALEKPVAFTGWLSLLNPWLRVHPS